MATGKDEAAARHGTVFACGEPALRRLAAAAIIAGAAPKCKGRELSRPVTAVPQPKAAGMRVGRNDACPCGSGKKRKKCHG